MTRAILPVFFLALLLAGVLTACSEQSAEPEPIPTVASFTSQALTIQAGETTKLYWTGATEGARLELSHNFRYVTGKSFVMVSPPETTTYTLTISNNAGENSYQHTITVLQDTAPQDNRAPSASDLDEIVQKNTPLALQLSGRDPDGDALSFTLVREPVHGSVTQFDAVSGELTYTPAPDYLGSDSFSYQVDDGNLTSREATVNLMVVSGLNTAPTAANRSIRTSVDAPLSITLEGTDPDGDALIFMIESEPSHGSLKDFDAAEGLVTYTPAPGYTGEDSFSFSVTDGSLGSSPATVTITVGGDNTTPTAQDQGLTTDEDTPLPLTLKGADADGDDLMYIILQAPQHGSISGTAPALNYSPDKDYFGADSFTFITSDGLDESEMATVSLTVRPVNDAPVADAQTRGVAEDGSLDFSLTGSDVEDDVLSFILTSEPMHGTLSDFDDVGGTLSYTPEADYEGTDSFSFKVNDGARDSAEATITLVVGGDNDAPVADNQTLTTDEDTPKALTLTATDAENDSLSYIIVSEPANGELSGTAPNLIYTPYDDYAGEDSFSFKVNDGSLDSNTATVSLSVTAVNDAPEAFGQNRSAQEDTPLDLVLFAWDIEDDELSFAVVSGPSHGSLSDFDATSGTVTYTPASNYAGSDSFTFRVSDGDKGSSPATVTIEVSPVNDAPEADNQSLTTDEDTAKTVTLTGSDVDDDSLSFTVVSQPAHGELSGTAPNLSYTPDANYHGADSFTFKVSDGNDDSGVATVSLTVEPVEDAPVASNVGSSLNEDMPATVTFSATDAEGDSLTYEVVSDPAHGTLSGSGAFRTYAPDANYYGTDSFTYRAFDGKAYSAPATVSLTVNAVNDAPIGTDSEHTIDEDDRVLNRWTATDLETATDSLTIRVGTGPSHGIVSIVSTGTGTYSPDDDYHGTDSFTLIANDGELDSEPFTVTVTIAPVNDAPVADGQDLSTDQGVALGITLTGSDVEDDPLTYTVTDGPDNGTLSGTAPNLSYTSDATFSGTDTFKFKVNDGELDSAEATVTIEVIEPTPPSIFYFDSDTIAEVGQSVTFSWEVTSEDGDPVSCTLDMGDGTTYTVSDCLSTTSKTHIYSASGSREVSLTASDDDGSDSAEHYVTAAVYDESAFNIHVVFDDDSLSATYQAAFQTAADRWAEVITGDLADLDAEYGVGCNVSGDFYGVKGNIDDLVIVAKGKSIDGVGGTLGGAAYCFKRSSDNLPFFGIMQFDTADLADLHTSGDLEEVILHEMGHVLGISKTGWNVFSLIDTASSSYTGAQGVSEYSTLEGSPQTSVPIEDGGGAGTKHSHWEESVFGHELMTGYLNAGVDNPLSRLTVATLKDMGYSVDFSKADSYSLPLDTLRLPGKVIELHGGEELEVIPVHP